MASPREHAGEVPVSPWQRSQVESAEVSQAPHVTSGAFFMIKLLTRRAQRRPIIFHKNGNDRAGRIARRVVLNWVQEKHLRGLSLGQTRALVLSDASKQSSTGRIKTRNKFTDPAWPRLAQLSEGRGCPEDQAYWPLLLVGLPSSSVIQEGSGLNLNRPQPEALDTLRHTECSNDSGELGQLHHREVKTMAMCGGAALGRKRQVGLSLMTA